MKGHWIEYDPIDLWFIERYSKLPRRELCARFNETFRRDVTQQNLTALCKRNGWLTGRTGCFEKGAVPLNKGKKMPFNANCARTQFKKGQRPRNAKYAGYERVDPKDGYVYISVNETNPHTGFARRFVLKHKWRWEQLHGPVPKGMCLKSKDGDRRNTDPSNWELIPRALLTRLNGRHTGVVYDDAPAELKPTIMAIAKLDHGVRERKAA